MYGIEKELVTRGLFVVIETNAFKKIKPIYVNCLRKNGLTQFLSYRPLSRTGVIQVIRVSSSVLCLCHGASFDYVCQTQWRNIVVRSAYSVVTQSVQRKGALGFLICCIYSTNQKHTYSRKVYNTILLLILLPIS